MGGFSAISAGNGWLISAMGISVVFFGLASLALSSPIFPGQSAGGMITFIPPGMFSLYSGVFS